MDVNCAVHLLEISSTQKWKNRHLKQCGDHILVCRASITLFFKGILILSHVLFTVLTSLWILMNIC